MEHAQKTIDILEDLHDSAAEMQAAVTGVSPELARRKPGPERWSVLECVEHVVIAEGRFLSWLEGPQVHEAPPQDRDKEAQLRARLANRDMKRVAPDPVKPSGRYAAVEEALHEFNAARQRSILFAIARKAHLPGLAGMHPSIGPLNGIEIMHLIVAHSRRHTAQILEIRREIE